MNLRISNQVTMVGSCLTVALSLDYKPIWFGKDPADFGTDMIKLQTTHGNVVAKAALAESADGGAADLKAVAESALEEAAFFLTRALASHFKKTGDLDRLSKVNVSKTAIVELRNQDLVTKTTEIRDIATVAVTEPDAANRGITAARIATLSTAISSFSVVMNTPRGQIVNRATLLKEVETDTAALLEQINDMDDLALQFDGTDAGKRFIAAWKRARQIVDSGHGPTAQPAPAPAPAATKP